MLRVLTSRTRLGAITVLLTLTLAGCGDDSGSDDDADDRREESSSPSGPTSDPTSATRGTGSTDSPSTESAAPLHECAEQWNSADLDARQAFSGQHRQDSAESGMPDIVVGRYEGDPLTLTGLDGEFTVESGSCMLVDVEGTTVDAEPQSFGSIAAVVDGTWQSAATELPHPFEGGPAPLTEPQVLVLTMSLGEAQLALPEPATP